MANQTFQATVKYPGREKPVILAIAVGGGSLTIEQLADRLEKINHFPGAESVELEELQGRAPRLEEVAKGSAMRAVNYRLKTTPKITVKRTEPQPGAPGDTEVVSSVSQAVPAEAIAQERSEGSEPPPGQSEGETTSAGPVASSEIPARRVPRGPKR